MLYNKVSVREIEIIYFVFGVSYKNALKLISSKYNVKSIHKIKKAKVEQAEEVYVPDPFDLIVELIITDRISAPP